MIFLLLIQLKHNKYIKQTDQQNLMFRSQSAENPRGKIYMTHLSQLLNNRIVQPQTQISNKLFPIDKLAPIQHTRSKSSVLISNKQVQVHLAYKNNKPQSYSSREITRNYSKKLEKNLHIQSLKFKSMQLSSDKPTSGKPMTFYKNPSFYQFNSTNLETESQPSSPPKSFLRKGSNIQKQIVINLLRSKIRKQNEDLDNNIYNKKQIIRMIQVFKGVALEQYSKNGVIIGQRQGNKPKQEQIKDIKGWQNQTLEYEIEYQRQ